MRYEVTATNPQFIEVKFCVVVEDEFALEMLAEDMEMHEGFEFDEAKEIQ
jgi:hypothetical protein